MTEKERAIIQSKMLELFLYGASEDLSEIYFENSVGESVIYEYISPVL